MLKIQQRTKAAAQADVFYPDSDGKPMAETAVHVNAMMCVHASLRMLFREYRGRDDVYVASNMFLYYEQGNPRGVKSPDVMVNEGVDASYDRRSWKLWEEGVAPSVVFEITSLSTWIEDFMNKGALYLCLGVQEYFIFDPLEEYLDNPLQGFIRQGGEYVPIEPEASGALYSPQLGAFLEKQDSLLRIFDPASGDRMPWDIEPAQRMKEAEQRAEQAEAEVARLRALLEEQNR